MTTALPSFQDPQLLITALTHRSALNESLSTATESNERLEYLGDAVLELAASKFLFLLYPDKPEGELTAFRSALVKTTTLAEVASDLELGQKMYLSKGEEAGQGRLNVSLLANTFEAVLGALYLDQGFEAVEAFLQQHLFPRFEQILQDKSYIDAKSLFQEKVQARGLPTPEYRVVSERGPDHDKEFTAEVVVAGKAYGRGDGKSKQAAQQAAARDALDKMA